MADLFPNGDGPPQDVVENLVFRVLVLARMAEDPSFAENIVAICNEDAVFYANTFAWVYEPRPRRNEAGALLPKELPYIAWPHQVPAIRTLEEYLGFSDIGGKKSRGEGASWIACIESSRWWSLRDGTKINVVSKDEDAADRKNDPDSLMWKMDFIVARLPRAFVGDPKTDYTRNYADHVLFNVRRSCSITAYAATADVASGGRADFFLMDELSKVKRPADEQAMASSQFVTDSRLFIATPRGAAGAYYDLMHEPSDMQVIVLDWKENPTRNRGLYVFRHGRPEAIDPVNNPLPPEYNPPSPAILARFERLRRRGFTLEGKVRSAWYDKQCDRPKATPESIAQELDMDFGGSQTRVLSARFFQVVEGTVRPPDKIGNFVVDDEAKSCKFVSADAGPLSMWMPLDERGKPQKARYVMGVDIAQGGAEFGANSVICVFSLHTREQVLEYVTSALEPPELAEMAVSIARWLGDCTIGWEENGPGSPFGRAVMLTYRYLDVYEEIRMDRKTKKKAAKPGWWSNRNKKWDLFVETSAAVQGEEIIVRSREYVDEAGQYVNQGGKVTHVKAGDDPAHGDRAIALGVANQVRIARPLPKPEEGKSGAPPAGSLAERLNLDERERERKEEKDCWNERTTASMGFSDSRYASRSLIDELAELADF